MAEQETVLCSATKDLVLCSATKDPKHVLQDESLFEPCFFKTSNVFRWSLSKCHATKTTT